MKKKTVKKVKYSEGDIGEFRIIDDFLPPPEELLFREEEVMVHIPMSRHSVDFFKKQASRHHKPYESVIRALLERYTERFE